MTRLVSAAVGALVLVLALVVSVAGPASAHSTQVWTLSGVTFDDGGTLSGTVTFGDDGSMVAADLTTSGGDQGTYGAQHYVASASGLSYTERPAGAGWDLSLSGGQYLHFAVPSIAGAEEGTSRSLPSGGYECLNCAPWRPIVAGSIVAGAVTDLDPPEITSAVDPTAPDGANGWYVGSPTVSFAATDPDTAISSSTGCDPTTITADTAGTTLTCEATSGGGTASTSVVVKRDATPPTLAPTLSTRLVLLHGAVAVDPHAADATSGLEHSGCQKPRTSQTGLRSILCNAEDAAGNRASTSVSYTVEYVMTPLVVRGGWHGRGKVTVSTRLTDAKGAAIAKAAAKRIGCRLKLALSGSQSHRSCLAYDPKTRTFSTRWRLGAHPGKASVEVSVSYPWTSVTTSRSRAVTITHG